MHICGILWEGPRHQETPHKLPRSYIAKFAPPTPFVTGRLLMMVATFKALSFLVAASPTLLVWPFFESPPFLFVGFEFHCFASYLDIPMFFEQCCLYSNQIVLYQLLFTTWSLMPSAPPTPKLPVPLEVSGLLSLRSLPGRGTRSTQGHGLGPLIAARCLTHHLLTCFGLQILATSSSFGLSLQSKKKASRRIELRLLAKLWWCTNSIQ